jgi:RHS repeat-associated protein
MFRALATRHSLLATVFLISGALLLAALPTFAQVATGTPPFSSSAGGPDVIDLANLNAHLDIPVLNKPGRGGYNFTYDLSYDTSLWFPSSSSGTNTWTVAGVGNWGWRGQTEIATGYVSRGPTTITCPNPQYPPTLPKTIRDTLFSNYVYHDSFGISHPIPNMTFDPGLCAGETSASGTAIDGSGYVLTVTTAGNTVTSTSGDLISAPTSSGSGSGSKTDRNGNEITVNSSGQFFDTLSSTTPVLTVSGTPPSNTVFTYTAPSGASASYTVKYTTYSIQTNFGCSGITEYGTNGNMTANLVSEIDLPDISVNTNDKYTFAYEPTLGHTGFVTGRLASVTLPTGGIITYAYTGGSSGHITCADGSAATLTRTTPDGTWTYAHSESGSAWTTLITDPAGNQTDMNFQGIYETQRQVYQGTTSGTLLRQWTTCYNGNTSNCNTTAITLPITQRTVNDQYGTSGLQCEHNYKYNSVGGLTEQDDYDYGSGAHGALLRKTLVTFASLENITAFQQQVTVQNGSGTVVSQTNYNYDQGTLQPTTGITQHASVSGSRGNLTSINYPVTALTANSTYYDTGVLNTSQDVNGALTTYQYSSTANAYCNWAFPTKVIEPLSLSRSMTWNCTGGVQLSTTDENSQVTSTTYSDSYFWRPASASDQESNSTGFYYGANPMWAAQSLLFNSNQSIAHTGVGFDGLGRLIFTDHAQSPSQTAWNAVQQSYDSNGRAWKTSAPCVTTGSWTCPTTGQTTTYDALNRISQVTDAGGGTTTYTYPQNDVLITVGPAPSGENTKRRQLEYNSIGQLTSVCELTSMTGSGPCGQNSAQTGYWTKYTYDVLGDLLTVTQNAQAASGSQQTRTYVYDAMSRLTSETNPESGTKIYVYDSDSTMCGNGAYTSAGNLVKTIDAVGNCVMRYYDALHRVTDVGTNSGASPCKRFRYDNTSGVLGTIPSGVSVSNKLGHLVEAETDTCASPITQSSMLTDEWFGYTSRGETSDTYESTPHSGASYYHSASTYWANGALDQLTGYVGSVLNYSAAWNLDGEGRPYSSYPVSGTTYNAASQPTQVNFTWGDSDSYTYDSNTGRMTQYQFTVNSQSNTGALTWNANGTLGQLGITDAFNPADTQTCNYVHDDLVRIVSANCGSAAAQTFSYDPFGNLNKSGSPFSFQPTYSTSTNRMTSLGSYTPTYDNDGNLLSDNLHSYTWDAYGNSASLDAVTALTFDALDRMVEQNRSGAYTQFLYAPTGFKMEILNGSTVSRLFVPLAGGGTAVYNAGGLLDVRHPDWLGSSRFSSTPSRTIYYDGAYAPFGDTYAQSGTTDLSFTGMNSDTTSGIYDFPSRPYSTQGRWPSPDRAGLAAVSPANPQSWNRYGYVLNSPLIATDPRGMGPCPLNNAGDSPCGAGGSCTVDGQSVDCSVTTAILAGGFGLQCPDNYCYGVNSSNLPVQFVATEVGGGYECIVSGEWGSANAAGIAAVGCANGLTSATGDEGCGTIYSGNGNYSFTLPTEGSPASCGNESLTFAPTGADFEGDYHSHPFNPNALSGQFSYQGCNSGQLCDIGFANLYNQGEPMFLGTPGGNVQVYDPNQAGTLPLGCVLVGSSFWGYVQPGVLAYVPKCQ